MFPFYEFDQALQAWLASTSMAAADINTAKQCIHELEQSTFQLGPQWRVKPFGGIANGFAVQGSDLDVTCYIEGMQASYAAFATHELQTRLLPLLQAHERFEVIDQIWTARVPILKLRFDRKLDVDLSCHNTEALPNTRLLRAYARLSPQVRELGLLIKLWAKNEGVCGAPQGHLSSYALTLMAIYYLQVDPAVRMPCLPIEPFLSEGGARSLGHAVSWSCPFTAAVLLARFFHFYAREFQWSTEVVSVRHGRRSTAADPVYDQLRAGLSPRIHIEDPFLTGRNLHCVLGLVQECALYTRICEAVQDMETVRLPAGLGWVPPSMGGGGVTAPCQGGTAIGAEVQAAPLAARTGELLQSDDSRKVRAESSDTTRNSHSGGSSRGEPSDPSLGSPSEWSTQPIGSDGGSEPFQGSLSREVETDVEHIAAGDGDSLCEDVDGGVEDGERLPILSVEGPSLEDIPMTSLIGSRRPSE